MKIKKITRKIVDIPEKFYDVIECTPHHNFPICTETSTIISHNCGFLDEIDFSRGGIKGATALDAQNGIMQSYTAVKERINSRFIKNGVQYGRLFLVSSKKSEHDFLEAYVKKMQDEGHAERMLIVDEPQWVIKPQGTFSSKTFPVAVGNRSLKSRILDSDISDEERKAIIKQGYEILDVPENFRQSFILDLNTALMNLAGRSVFGATSFFNFDMFSKCYVKDYKNPFVTEIITTGIHDDLKIQDFFQLDLVPTRVRMMPCFIHIDGSLTGDKTGISCVGAAGLKETKIYNGAYETTASEMVYKHIFTVAIQAPQGSEISFEKTRQFIYYLHASGFNIRAISLDGFQSADMKQMLLAQGYDASIVSLDKTPQGYLALRSAMNDGRIGLIQLDLLETELVQLQRDVQTGKIDHPPDGCFTDDTKIALVDGRDVSIRDLMIEQEYKDNYVYTINEITHEVEAKRIKRVFQTKLVTDILRIHLDNGSYIDCTDNHRFMLRDGSFVTADNLVIGQSLMPLYTKICDSGLVGYRLVYNPFFEKWNFEHRIFCSNVIDENGVVHHRNYNKTDNRPCNLIKISKEMHTEIHNNHTRNYKKISDSVRDWHRRMRYTDEYEDRAEKCRSGIIAHYKKTNPDYIPNKELREQKIKRIEQMFGVVWDDLTPNERNSYSVKLSRVDNPEICNRISDAVKRNHAIGLYKNAYKALANRHWYTNGTNNLYIQDGAQVPDGFYSGRTITERKQGIRLSDRPKEEQELIRRKCGNSSRGKRWITNGIVEKYALKDEPLPEGFIYGRLKREYKNHKIVKIEVIHRPCRVYDLEIEDNHNFALSAGVFVHNSKDCSDSLAGALFNATLHKQDLVDSLQIFDSILDVNTEVSPEDTFIGDLEQSISKNNASKVARDTLDSLLDAFSGNDGTILSW